MYYTAITSLEKIDSFISDFFALEIVKRTKIEITPDKQIGLMRIVLLPSDHTDGVRLDHLFQRGYLFDRGWNLVFTKNYS